MLIFHTVITRHAFIKILHMMGFWLQIWFIQMKSVPERLYNIGCTNLGINAYNWLLTLAFEYSLDTLHMFLCLYMLLSAPFIKKMNVIWYKCMLIILMPRKIYLLYIFAFIYTANRLTSLTDKFNLWEALFMIENQQQRAFIDTNNNIKHIIYCSLCMLLPFRYKSYW